MINKKFKKRSDIILECVAEWFEVRVKDLIGQDRHRSLTHARQAGYWLVMDMLDWSSMRTATLFGNRDHSTIIYGAKSFEDKVKKDALLQRELKLVRLYILSRIKEYYAELNSNDALDLIDQKKLLGSGVAN